MGQREWKSKTKKIKVEKSAGIERCEGDGQEPRGQCHILGENKTEQLETGKENELENGEFGSNP
jgi:hypothetical protein